MTPLLQLSPLGLLGLWDDLLTARYGDNGFGGDTAEIYAYRCASPGAATTLMTVPGDAAMLHDAAIEAAQGLHAIIALFIERHRVTVEVDGRPFGPWVASRPFNYRAHVSVTPTERRP